MIEVIRLLDENSCMNKELIGQYIKDKNTIVVTSGDNDLPLEYLFDYEMADYYMSSAYIKAIELADYLRQMGLLVRVVEFKDIGIYTNNNFLDANIERVDSYFYDKNIPYYNCLIVPGGIGNYNNNPTILGNGGSDVTAVSIASRMGVELFFYQEGSELKIINNYERLYDLVMDKEINLSYKALLQAKNNNLRVVIGDICV